MLALDAAFLLPGHGLPVVGADRVRRALTDTADLLDSLVDQTLAVMNSGGRLDDAIHAVRPPAELEERPYLRPVYDEPEFIVHTVWRQYGGWWDGNPATLKPARERALATELAALAGGAGVLAERALELLARATGATAVARATGAAAATGATGAAAEVDEVAAEQDLRLAGHLAESAWLASPADGAVQQARQQVFAARAERATSTMARGVFTWAAGESVQQVDDAERPPHPH
jgi:hypothetical protein